MQEEIHKVDGLMGSFQLLFSSRWQEITMVVNTIAKITLARVKYLREIEDLKAMALGQDREANREMDSNLVGFNQLE